MAQQPASKRPRHEPDGAHDAAGAMLEPLLFYPHAAEEAAMAVGAAAGFPRLGHTDPECHVR